MVLYLAFAGLVKEWLSLPTGATWSTPLTSSMALNWVVEGENVGQTQKNLEVLYEEYMYGWRAYHLILAQDHAAQ